MQNIRTKNKLGKEQSFKISRMKEVIKPTSPHKHPGYHEFILLSDGAGIHTIDEADYEVNPPVLFYLKGGQVHCWDFTQIPKGYVLLFKEEFINEWMDSLQLLSALPTQMRIEKNSMSVFTDIELMMKEYETNANEQILKSYLNIIIHKVSSLSAVNQSVVKENVLIMRFKSLVDENYKEKRELEFYAAQLNLSRRQLSALCTKEIGRSASSVIAERLVLESKRLLRYTTHTISEIAFDLHFTDASHFVKFFKTKTNLTPLEFRKRF